MATLQQTNIVQPGQVVAAGGWNAIFENDHPLNFEIGIGGGDFILALGERHPNENFVGVDIAGKYLRKAARKAARRGLTNIRFMTSEAKALLYEVFVHESLQAVYINFPDPWPKKGHEKRRLFDEHFIELVEDRLEPEGYIYLGTDVPEYAEQAYEALSSSSILANAYASPWLHDRAWTGLETKYEQKWKALGKPCFYLAFRKARGLRTPRYEMAYETFEPFDLGSLDLEEAAKRLDQPHDTYGKYIVKPMRLRLEHGKPMVKILLIDKVHGHRDFLHGLLRSEGDRLVYDIQNRDEIVWTEAKRRVLSRFFEQVVG